MLALAWRRRDWPLFREWFAHRRGLMFWAVVVCASPLTEQAPWVAWVLPAAALLTYVLGEHGRPCRTCIHELTLWSRRQVGRHGYGVAIEMPRRIVWSMQLEHWIDRSLWNSLGLTLGWFAWLSLLGGLVPASWHPGWWQVPYVVILWWPWWLRTRTSLVHHRFSAMCPWCYRWGGGGGHVDPEPTPTPDPSREKDLVPA